MNKELSIIVLKERIDFIKQELSKDEFTVLEYEDNNFLKVVFNKIDCFTLLGLFHAGFLCGAKS
jgi:hypothetical protein